MSDDQAPDTQPSNLPAAEPAALDESPFPVPPLEPEEKGLDPSGKETRDGA